MAAADPRRPRTGLWVGLGVIAVLVVVLGVVLVVGLSGSPAPAPTPGPVTTTTAAPVDNRLAAVFPDINTLGSNCTPYQPAGGEYTTSTGVQASAIIRCNYGASVPGGYVYYTQWPTAAAARQWHDDQLTQGPSLDNIRNWGTQSNPNQGPLHTRAASDGSVYATAAYADRPYGFDIVTPTLDGSNAMFTNMHLLPASSVPS
jgi:hypothetical protein